MNVRIAIRTVLRHLGIAAVCIVAPRNISAAPPPATAPNILIILTDDQGRGDYSAFGTRDIRTPNIDRLFREGHDVPELLCQQLRLFADTRGAADRLLPGSGRRAGRDSRGDAGQFLGLSLAAARSCCRSCSSRPATTPRSSANGISASARPTRRPSAALISSRAFSAT